MDNKPNILFMMTDHQRSDTLGMIQCGREVTPNLNRLIERSAQFTRAYTTCPLCVPARTALATGIYPTKTKVVFNDWQGKTAQPLEPIHTTLKRSGYTVGHVGVDHIKVVPSMREQGLDYFINQEDYEAWASSKNIVVERGPEDITLVDEDVEGTYISKRYSSHNVTKWEYPIELFKDHYYIDHAIRFLDEVKEEPFALFTYLWAPHPPLKVPEPFASMYDPERITLPSNLNISSNNEPQLRRKGVPAQLAENTSIDHWKKVWAGHLGLTTMADELLGKLIDKLEKEGKLDNTLVVFTADHGDSLGQHKLYQKMEMYEECVHVPLVIKIPNGVCRKIDMPVSHLDLVPTLHEMIGYISDTTEGISLLSTIKGIATGEDRMIFSQYSGNPSYGTIRRAVISKNFKYVYDNNCEHELYDLQKDPREMNNIAGDESYRGIVETLHTECKAFHLKQKDYFKW